MTERTGRDGLSIAVRLNAARPKTLHQTIRDPLRKEVRCRSSLVARRSLHAQERNEAQIHPP